MELNDSSLQNPNKGLFNSVLHSSVAAPVLKLRILKVACLQCHNVTSKKRLSPIGFSKHTRRNFKLLHIFPLEPGAPYFLRDR